METKQGTLPEIRKTVMIHASIEKVWEVVSTAEGIASWWMPSTMKPELGRDFILHSSGFGDSPCKVTELDPPHRLGFDWSDGWHVAFELKQHNAATEFTLIHSGWEADKATPFGQQHAIVREIMDGGWETIVKEKLPAVFQN